MNSRTLLIVGGIALIGIIVLGLTRGEAVPETSEPMPVEELSPTPVTSELSTGSEEASLQLPNATVNVPEMDGMQVTLVNGSGTFDDGVVRGTVTLLPGVFAERATDTGFDLYGVLYVNYGGSGEFAYLALFQYFADALVHQDSAPIGDRVDINLIGTRATQNPQADYEAVVDFMTFGPDQAMAEEPNTQAQNIYLVKDHKFVSSEPVEL